MKCGKPVGILKSFTRWKTAEDGVSEFTQTFNLDFTIPNKMAKMCPDKSIKPEMLLLFIFNCLFFFVVDRKYDSKPDFYTFDLAATLLISVAACSRI